MAWRAGFGMASHPPCLSDRQESEHAYQTDCCSGCRRLAAIEQLGKLGDPRGGKALAPAVDDKNAPVVKAAVIALYQMKIAPDAKKVMGVFDAEVLDAWYGASGDPQKDAKGQYISRREGGISILERGLPDFDYATYVREGSKLQWVRQDDHTLYLFFGVPWKVQQRACVPELVKLLDDEDKRVRWWAVECLTHTVEDKTDAGGMWVDGKMILPKDTSREEEHWRTWWKEKGKAYLEQPVKVEHR